MFEPQLQGLLEEDALVRSCVERNISVSNCGSQSSQWRMWILKQSSIPCISTRLCNTVRSILTIIGTLMEIENCQTHGKVSHDSLCWVTNHRMDLHGRGGDWQENKWHPDQTFCGQRFGKICLTCRNAKKSKSGRSRNQSSTTPKDCVVFTFIDLHEDVLQQCWREFPLSSWVFLRDEFLFDGVETLRPGQLSWCHFVLVCTAHQSMEKYEFDDCIFAFTTEMNGKITPQLELEDELGENSMTVYVNTISGKTISFKCDRSRKQIQYREKLKWKHRSFKVQPTSFTRGKCWMTKNNRRKQHWSRSYDRNVFNIVRRNGKMKWKRK